MVIKSFNVYEFGSKLIDSNDLDPVYVLLHQAQLGEELLHKWLLAYWCFYHVGTASWIANNSNYWLAMEIAARSKEYPRSSERRHFRAENARKSVEYLRSRGIKNLFAPLTVSGYQYPVEEILKVVKGWVGFGPWIAFKVADMLERLGLISVQFSVATSMYDSPMKGARILWDQEGSTEKRNNQYVGFWAVYRILDKLGDVLAPPRYERTINVQEVETILCKWSSYLGGHYHPGEDIESVEKGLKKFPTCDLATHLLESGKAVGLWK